MAFETEPKSKRAHRRRQVCTWVVLALSCSLLSSAYAQKKSDLKGVRPVPAFALIVGNLIGELQRERAEAVRYASLRDGGKGFDLHPQWARTDAAVLEVDGFLKENGKHISSNVITTLDRARKDIAAIEGRRQVIEGFIFYNYQAYDYYTLILDPLVASLAALAESGDPMARTIKAYAHATQLQEAAARERDFIIQIIGGVGRKVTDKSLTALITMQQTNSDALLQAMDADQKQFVRAQLSGAFLDNVASLQTQAITAAKSGEFDSQLVANWQKSQSQYLSRIVLVVSRLGQDLRGTAGGGPSFGSVAALSKYAVPLGVVVALLLLILLMRNRRATVPAATAPTTLIGTESVRVNAPQPVSGRRSEEVVFSGRPSVSLTLVKEGESAGDGGVGEITVETAPQDLRHKIESAVTSFQTAEDHLKVKKD